MRFCRLPAARRRLRWILHTPQSANVLDGMLVLNPLAQRMQIALLILTMLTVLMFIGSTFTQHVSEYLALILLATVSMMFLASTQNLLLIFLSLELLSLSLYVLTAFNKRSVRSAEAALKYFVFGGISAAFLLFGFSLLYGLSNSTNLVHIAGSIHGPILDPLLVVAIVMTVVGLGFKVAAVPFHFWAPDVYQGAPATSAALIASGSKVAGFFIFYQVMVIGLAGAEGSAVWHGYASGMGSGRCHCRRALDGAGKPRCDSADQCTAIACVLRYCALGLYVAWHRVAHRPKSSRTALLRHHLCVDGPWGVRRCGYGRGSNRRRPLSDFAGLSRRAPVPSFCMLVFMLSLAGIPPFAGFFGKFYLFSAVLTSTPGTLGLLWLVVLAVAMSAVSLYYYLKVLKCIYVSDPPADTAPIRVSFLRQVVLCLIALSVLLLGCAPNLLLHWL